MERLAMGEPELQAAASEIRRHYDRCTQAVLHGDPDGFAAAFGPAARSETAEGVPITMGQMLDYVAWRTGRTVAAHSFVVQFDSVEDTADEVCIEFTEDSSATVLDPDDRPVRRVAHSVNRVVWRREDGEWSPVEGVELEVRRTVDGVVVAPDADPVGVPAYRAGRSRGGGG
jgi:hypothetical protein